MAMFWYQKEAAYRIPHRLEQPLGTCANVVRSSNAGSSMRDSRTPWLYGERAGASRSPLEGF